MPVFTIQTPEGKRLKIEAADEAAAIRGAQNWSLQNRKPTATREVTGALANVNRGALVGDELAAAGGVISGLVSGRHRFGLDKPGNPIVNNLDMLKDAFKAELAGQREQEQDFAARRPRAAALARGTGTAATALAPTGSGLLAPASRAVNMARGGLLASASGAAAAGLDEGTVGERVQRASKAAVDPLTLMLGAGGGALLPSKGGLLDDLREIVPEAPAPKPRAPKEVRPQDTLKQAGVFLTPGQRMGGIVKNAEDLAQRAPIVGPAIRGARRRGVESFNRSFALRALDAIDQGVPKSVKTGNKTVAYVAKALGDEYDKAAAMVPQVAPDNELVSALSGINSQLDELGSDVASQYQTVLKNRLFSRLGVEGLDDIANARVIDGPTLREIQSDIGSRAAKFSASDDAAQQGLGEALEAVSDELKNLLGRYSPEAGERIAKANQGWAQYVRLRNAASRSPGGIASPGQFRTAVRMSDRSVGKGNVAQGRAIGQDLADAAAEVMPDAFGSPGTADAVGLGALGAQALYDPGAAALTATGLTAAATPYFLAGRKVLERLPDNASKAELMRAAAELRKLAASDPAVQEMYRQVVARLAVAGGATGALATAQGASSQ